MRIRRQSSSPLQKRRRRGFRGYPVATIAFYGPDGDRASKVAVGIVEGEGREPSHLERWLTEDTDARSDESIGLEILRFIQAHDVRTVVMGDDLLGCPHEEGIDYAEGGSCPKCPYWAGRDRFTRERIQ